MPRVWCYAAYCVVRHFLPHTLLCRAVRCRSASLRFGCLRLYYLPSLGRSVFLRLVNSTVAYHLHMPALALLLSVRSHMRFFCLRSSLRALPRMLVHGSGTGLPVHRCWLLPRKRNVADVFMLVFYDGLLQCRQTLWRLEDSRAIVVAVAFVCVNGSPVTFHPTPVHTHA
jgi:hypothetical protein